VQVILNEYIHGLGHEGDVVKVKPGFGRNFLLPYGKALRHTKENLARFEKDRTERLARIHKLKDSAVEVLKFLEAEPFIVLSQASQEGHLYGTVRPLTIYKILHEKFPMIKKESICLPYTIKEIGEYSFQVRIHPEVTITAPLYVFPSQEEAMIYIEERDRKIKREAEEAAKRKAEEAAAAVLSTSDTSETETDSSDAAPIEVGASNPKEEETV